MRENLNYPRKEAAESILRKIGINPSTRIDDFDQDFEYTTCRIDELARYLDLYTQQDTNENEKRILGCYFFECLNQYIQEHDKEHSLQSRVLDLVFNDKEIHEVEIEYWLNTDDPNPENWWPINQYLANREST